LAQRNGRPRLTTGVAALDDVLGGGFPQGSIIFITGLPGAGKTILSEQAFFANAAQSRPCLYMTTLSEPPAKLLRFAQDFEFFQADLVEHTAFFAPSSSSSIASRCSASTSMTSAPFAPGCRTSWFC
jgi:circadian clock protein KaiC